MNIRHTSAKFRAFIFIAAIALGFHGVATAMPDAAKESSRTVHARDPLSDHIGAFLRHNKIQFPSFESDPKLWERMISFLRAGSLGTPEKDLENAQAEAATQGTHDRDLLLKQLSIAVTQARNYQAMSPTVRQKIAEEMKVVADLKAKLRGICETNDVFFLGTSPNGNADQLVAAIDYLSDNYNGITLYSNSLASDHPVNQALERANARGIPVRWIGEIPPGESSVKIDPAKRVVVGFGGHARDYDMAAELAGVIPLVEQKIPVILLAADKEHTSPNPPSLDYRPNPVIDALSEARAGTDLAKPHPPIFIVGRDEPELPAAGTPPSSPADAPKVIEGGTDIHVTVVRDDLAHPEGPVNKLGGVNSAVIALVDSHGVGAGSSDAILPRGLVGSIYRAMSASGLPVHGQTSARIVDNRPVVVVIDDEPGNSSSALLAGIRKAAALAADHVKSVLVWTQELQNPAVSVANAVREYAADTAAATIKKFGVITTSAQDQDDVNRAFGPI